MSEELDIEKQVLIARIKKARLYYSMKGYEDMRAYLSPALWYLVQTYAEFLGQKKGAFIRDSLTAYLIDIHEQVFGTYLFDDLKYDISQFASDWRSPSKKNSKKKR